MKNLKFLNTMHTIGTKDREDRVDTLNQAVSPTTDTKAYVFYLSVLAIVLSCAALFMVSKGSSFTSPNFVVVDMNQLLRQKAAALVHTNKELGSEDGKKEMQLESYAKHIRQVIENYASENKVIVVAKGAVFGKELVEVTDAISSRL
jgi:hypothetical protein